MTNKKLTVIAKPIVSVKTSDITLEVNLSGFGEGVRPNGGVHGLRVSEDILSINEIINMSSDSIKVENILTSSLLDFNVYLVKPEFKVITEILNIETSTIYRDSVYSQYIVNKLFSSIKIDNVSNTESLYFKLNSLKTENLLFLETVNKLLSKPTLDTLQVNDHISKGIFKNFLTEANASTELFFKSILSKKETMVFQEVFYKSFSLNKRENLQITEHIIGNLQNYASGNYAGEDYFGTNFSILE